ncbi:MAG: energy transducer TonB [Kiritimatiellia bacterium]
MRRNRDLLTGFMAALAVHAVFGLAAGTWVDVRRRSPLPQFRLGESAVELTLVAPGTPRNVAAEPEIQPKDPGKPALIEEKPEKRIEEQPVPGTGILSRGAHKTPVVAGEIHPNYPLTSRIRGEEGVVVVRAWVTAEGRARKVEVVKSSGYGALDREAARALGKAAFVAAGGGRPAPGPSEFTVRFDLVE